MSESADLPLAFLSPDLVEAHGRVPGPLGTPPRSLGSDHLGSYKSSRTATSQKFAQNFSDAVALLKGRGSTSTATLVALTIDNQAPVVALAQEEVSVGKLWLQLL